MIIVTAMLTIDIISAIVALWFAFSAAAACRTVAAEADSLALAARSAASAAREAAFWASLASAKLSAWEESFTREALSR